jgi:hypothetical protein
MPDGTYAGESNRLPIDLSSKHLFTGNFPLTFIGLRNNPCKDRDGG